MLYWKRPKLLIQTFRSSMVPQKLSMFLEQNLEILPMTTTELMLHFHNEILQMSKFFVSWDKFSKIAEIFLKFENVKPNWEIQRLKNSFEK